MLAFVGFVNAVVELMTYLSMILLQDDCGRKPTLKALR